MTPTPTRDESMLRATSAQAPLHDDLPPFSEAPPRPPLPWQEEISQAFDRELARDALPDPDDLNLAWSYERATD